ncbi:hypothetical protein KUTeg_008388 [Tegillarca granosa]|uniref:Solute carrier family 23 member 2 n=1 Tax=Tegillarca granosa TaxID=220873 RepID=A0ABQ9FD93_TEGGR|nr:hypothetical protein KUTeg_008388 [Tegillarca granosa]
MQYVVTEVTNPDDSADNELLYSVDEVPPWYLCIILGFQHYLTAFGSNFTVPLVLAPYFCIGDDKVGLSEIISTIFFVSGLSTLIQTTFGIRLPIIQGSTFAFLTPTMGILSLPQWTCPYTQKGANLTELPDYGSPRHREMWYLRLCEIQGAVMIASLFQIVIGFSGLIGVILRFIGPLSIVPTITLIGLSLFPAAADLASKNWYIALMTMFLIALFSQYLRNISVPMCRYEKGKGCGVYRLQIFKLFPILLAMVLSWLICAILTVAGAFPDDKSWGYEARTDIKTDVIRDALWFRFPYPGQWGLPTVSVAGVFGILAGVLASMMESLGDYYACARLSGAPPPPPHAINRGIGVEGIGCVIAGALGSGNGTTSYSENVGAIGITKVGSRRVVQVGGIIMILLGCLGKFGALFVTIPDPVVGGVFMITFGMITAVGLSNLQFVNMNSSRNIFVIGTSLFFGLSFPVWMRSHSDYIRTGSDIANQIISVLLSTSMFVGGVAGFVLDNTIPGTPEERGIRRWRNQLSSTEPKDGTESSSVYDLPLIQKYLDRVPLFNFLPFCPRFDLDACCGRVKRRSNSANIQINNDVVDSATNVAYDSSTHL